jgi:S1-C subfamily serine protease
VTKLDWVALGIVGLTAFSGLRRGLVTTALSLAGLVAGAIVGARVAPHFLHGGAHSPYTPMVGLAGAVVGAAVLQTLWVLPPLKFLDSLGGLLAGAAMGLAAVWVAGAAFLQVPSQLPGLQHARRLVQQSLILKRLDTIVPPRTILNALGRIDPFPLISGPTAPTAPVDRRVLQSSGVAIARRSVVRVRTTACGLGIEGSGWAVRPHLFVTAAHVVAGGSGITVDGHAARVVAVDRRNDVAVLRVPGLLAVPLRFADPHDGDPVAILGYPEDGPFNAQPGRVGSTAYVRVSGSTRLVTALRGRIRHGNSGGPAVNSRGEVEATIFAARSGFRSGFGVPAVSFEQVFARARGSVSTGSCWSS